MGFIILLFPVFKMGVVFIYLLYLPVFCFLRSLMEILIFIFITIILISIYFLILIFIFLINSLILPVYLL